MIQKQVSAKHPSYASARSAVDGNDEKGLPEEDGACRSAGDAGFCFAGLVVHACVLA